MSEIALLLESGEPGIVLAAAAVLWWRISKLEQRIERHLRKWEKEE